ncbi:MAG: type II toxin-antitoxin system HipA family toxin [Lachnospiraceae bacterium]|nr:type II toxin-antitoxin system HipA family toxin [Lachnospiraceae bacterium]
MIAAEVYLWGSLIGVVEQEDVSDVPRFSYDPSFQRSGIEVSPLVMPLSARVFSFPSLNEESFHRLPGLLADSLPDKFGTRLIERYLSDRGRTLSSLTAVERLCYTGSRGMGALEYVPSLRFSDTKDGTVDVEALIRLASDVLNERESMHIGDSGQMMEQILQIGTSAGGARAKAVVAWNEETGDIRSGQVDAGSGYGYWIIKFDGVENNKDKGNRPDDRAYTRIEYAYSLMATAAGIRMQPCRLLKRAGHFHFMTKRFDRDAKTGDKLHVLTLGGLAHFDYNAPGAHSYEQAAQVLRGIGAGQDDTEELFRRMVFNVITRNHDDHVKNSSFLMNRDGQWRLSPAYDITFAFAPSNYWLARHQMSVNGKQEEIEEEDILSCGRSMDLGRGRMKRIIGEVREAAGAWRRFAEESNVPEKKAEAIGNCFCFLEK